MGTERQVGVHWPRTAQHLGNLSVLGHPGVTLRARLGTEEEASHSDENGTRSY
jgi:hypothetical protein